VDDHHAGKSSRRGGSARSLSKKATAGTPKRRRA
jgi:hypothetical protein